MVKGKRLKMTMLLEADSFDKLDLMRDRCFEDIQRGVRKGEGFWVWTPGFSKYEVEIEDIDE